MTSFDAIINRQLLRWEGRPKPAVSEEGTRCQVPGIVTISRQTGSRGSYFASRLAQKLDFQRMHREIIDLICAEPLYHDRIVDLLDANCRSELDEAVAPFLDGLTLEPRDYFGHLFRSILSMSSLGGVILVGRGGNFILGPARGCHIRFIAPKARRIENLVKYKNMDASEAGDMIDKSDEERSRFIRQLYDADINDPIHYDLVINSSLIDIEELLVVAMASIRGKLNKLTYLDND